MVRAGRILATLAVASVVMLTAIDFAEARRAGSGFGSRGSRTFSQPPATRTNPGDAAPINRTMTPQQQGANPQTGQQQTGQQARPGAQRPGGLFGGLGGSLLGGLALGGLIGMLMGNGLGGAAGFLGLLLQVALIGGAVMLAMRFFGRRRQPAFVGPQGGAGAQAAGFGGATYSPRESTSGMPSFRIPPIGGGGAKATQPAQRGVQDPDEIGVAPEDLDTFEAMLKQVQAAYGAEDYGTLRKLTTPEAMSWLAEELSDNATKGLKNEVRDVHLVQGDVAEAWREEGDDYATVAMRYESIDVTRNRATGEVVEGDPDQPTEAVELWTFLRKRGGDWQVSAIQGMAA
ncbi:Tim44 domain-containing protein [Pararhizobium gei]|uniref:Tim44 domain-containing protein n=1 Tax=Pararhizobium gei TaxID=1395951 RepID=UPI0023DB2078|nr:Tim44 domain-containing protein [Rhizobium gei]